MSNRSSRIFHKNKFKNKKCMLHKLTHNHRREWTDHVHCPLHSCRRRHPKAAACCSRDHSNRPKSAPYFRPARVCENAPSPPTQITIQTKNERTQPTRSTTKMKKKIKKEKRMKTRYSPIRTATQFKTKIIRLRMCGIREQCRFHT